MSGSYLFQYQVAWCVLDGRELSWNQKMIVLRFFVDFWGLIFYWINSWR